MINLIFMLAASVAAVVIFVLSFDYSSEAGSFPRAVAALIFFLLVYEIWKQQKKNSAASGGDKNEKSQGQVVGLQWYWTFIIVVLYVVSLQILGFWISSFVMLAVLPFMIGDRSYVRIGLFSFLTVIVTWVVFRYFLKVGLPGASW